MNLIQESFHRLFPDKQFNYTAELEYNRRLSDFNANIKLRENTIKLNLNLQWKDIDDEIKIGLIQSLLLRIFKQKHHTLNINLYNNFVRNIHILTPKIAADPALASSFRRISQQFFRSQMEQPNLVWGQASCRKLASYNFHNDTITISTLFQDAPQQIIDYLMYHELLHKFHKFMHQNGRSYFHSRAFCYDEQQFPNHLQIEQQINQHIKSKREITRKSLFEYFWK